MRQTSRAHEPVSLGIGGAKAFDGLMADGDIGALGPVGTVEMWIGFSMHAGIMPISSRTLCMAPASAGEARIFSTADSGLPWCESTMAALFKCNAACRCAVNCKLVKKLPL